MIYVYDIVNAANDIKFVYLPVIQHIFARENISK